MTDVCFDQPTWRRRWRPNIGASWVKARMQGKPTPTLFKTLDEVLDDRFFAQKKRRFQRLPLNSGEGEVLRAIRIRNVFARARAARAQQAALPAPRFDLRRELLASDAVRAFARERAAAERLYDALCNVDWEKEEVSDGISWRGAGALVARVRGMGEDYLDYYCSGNEGVVAADAAKLLAGLGWTPVGVVPT